MVDHPPEVIVVYSDLEIISAFGGEHQELMDERSREDPGSNRMLVRYWPDQDWLVFTWPNRPMDVREGGVMEDQFNALYGYLSAKYRKFGKNTKVDWMMGVDEPKTVEEEIFEGRPRSPRLPAQESIQGYMPSGRPIRFGDRRPFHVRGHRRRA